MKLHQEWARQHDLNAEAEQVVVQREKNGVWTSPQAVTDTLDARLKRWLAGDEQRQWSELDDSDTKNPYHPGCLFRFFDPPPRNDSSPAHPAP